MSGYFVVSRAVFDHVDFAPEPFTEREAWLWLISEAAWKPTRVRIGSAGVPVVLARGEVAHSLRFMADKWKWSVKEVRGFIDRSKKQGRLTQKRAHDGAILTICNYDKFQLGGHTEGQSEGTPRAHEGHKEEEVKKGKNTSSPSQGLIEPASAEIVEELETVLGINPEFVPPEWCGAEMRVSAMLRERIPPEVIISAVRQRSSQMKAKGQSPPQSFAYYEKAIAEALARAVAPVPKAKIIPAETFEVKRAEKLRTNSPTDAARRNLERLRESRIRDGADNPDGR